MRILLIVLLLSGCATSVRDTMETARDRCNHQNAQVTAIIENKGGEEFLRVKCTWIFEVQTFE